MESRAYLSFARVGAQKARLVADLVRNKNVNEAIQLLTTSSKKSAIMIRKLIQSAVANADQTKQMDLDTLYVKHISVDAGPVMKRFTPRAQGRAAEIRKKTSHINVVLDER